MNTNNHDVTIQMHLQPLPQHRAEPKSKRVADAPPVTLHTDNPELMLRKEGGA